MKKLFNLLFVGSALMTFKFGIYLIIGGTLYSLHMYKDWPVKWAAIYMLGMSAISLFATAIDLTKKK